MTSRSARLRMAPQRVHEFLTELFPALGRVTEVQRDTVSYHLDYGGSTRWDLMEEALGATTRRELHRLVAKYAPAATPGR